MSDEELEVEIRKAVDSILNEEYPKRKAHMCDKIAILLSVVAGLLTGLIVLQLSVIL